MNTHSTHRILIMEEDGNLVHLYGQMLRHSGYELYEVSSLHITTEFLQLGLPIDLFICNVTSQDSYKVKFLERLKSDFERCGTHLLLYGEIDFPVLTAPHGVTVLGSSASTSDVIEQVYQIMNAQPAENYGIAV